MSTRSLFPVGFALLLEIIVDKERFESPRAFRHSVPGTGDIDLIPGRCLPTSIGRDLRLAWEGDEDFWVENRKRVLVSDLQVAHQVLPESFRARSSCCLVNAAVFPARNLRTYITLYRRVVIVMPLSSHYPEALSAFRVAENDLIELATRGRLQFVLPQSLDRYPIRLLEQLAEAAPQSLLFSRRLAAATIAESRRRIPFLYLPFGPADRRVLLSLLNRVASDETLGSLAAALIRELGEIWCSAEARVNFQGAMATPALGAGRLLSAVFQYITGRDLLIEFFSAAGPVEWAAALGATVFPVEVDGYSEQAATELCASAYSGIRDQPIPTSLGDVETVVDGLLALDNDAPILDVERAFGNTNVDRLGEVVRRIASNSLDHESLRTAIVSFNNNVQQYEERADRLTRWDLLTLGGAIACATLQNVPGINFIPIGVWLLRYLLIGADPSRDPGGRVIDWIRGVNAWTTGDVVLISRLRRKLSS